MSKENNPLHVELYKKYRELVNNQAYSAVNHEIAMFLFKVHMDFEKKGKYNFYNNVHDIIKTLREYPERKESD